MPPDPSTQSVHQADPFATLALRPGWLVSRLGIAARTGLDAEVTAYSIIFWLHDALPAQDMIAWQEQKARITAEMALAGQKGAYGKLGALSSDLNRAFEDHVELSLRAGAGAHIRTEAVQALADGISASTACRLLAWSICRNHVHVIAELTGEMGVDELVCSWKALAPAVNWESAYHAEALKAVGGSGDPAKIADDVKVAKEKFDTLQTTHAAELAKISKRSALQMALNGKVYDPSDIIGLLDMDKIEVSDDGSLKTDLEGLLKPIKESKAYLFKEDPAKTPPVHGATPADPGPKTPPAAGKVDGPVCL